MASPKNKYPVTVRVRTRGQQPFSWAGELWQPIMREFDAHPIHVDDLSKHAAQVKLHVEWPVGFVHDDGHVEGEARGGKIDAATSSSDLVAAARAEAERYRTIAQAAERESIEARASVAEELSGLKSKVADLTSQLAMRDTRLVDCERNRSEALTSLQEAKAGHTKAIAGLMSVHASALDAVRVEARAAIEKTKMEADKLISDALTEMEAAQRKGGGKKG